MSTALQLLDVESGDQQPFDICEPSHCIPRQTHGTPLLYRFAQMRAAPRTDPRDSIFDLLASVARCSLPLASWTRVTSYRIHGHNGDLN